MPDWTPEIEVPPDLVRTLIARQFPSLRVERIELLGEGWDNVVYQVNGEWLFRLPRRQVAVPGVRTEIEVLSYLAGRLPLPIPAPVFRGAPDEPYTWPWFGYRIIEGREIADLEPGLEQRAALARPLATFLAALHDPAHARALSSSLPADPIRRSDVGFRGPKALELLGTLQAARRIDDVEPWRRVIDAAQGAKGRLESVVHGDFHFRHLLLDDAIRPVGVIDWGDCCLNDPAVDLQLYWSLLPGSARPAFLEVYGSIAEERLAIARVLAIFLSAALANYGHQTGQTAILQEAVRGLHFALEDG